MKKVYITPRSITKDGHPSLEKLEDVGFELILGPPGQQPSEEDQFRIVPDCVAYLAGIEPIRATLLETAKNLKVISRNGIGIDNIDIEAAKRLGIKVKIAPGSFAQSVAELAIGLIFNSFRSIPLSNKYVKEGEWARADKGIELDKKILGIIGCGNIGKRVIKMALGLGMNVLGYDLYPDKDFNPGNNFKYTDFEEILTKSDVISLHCPPGDKPLINEETIGKMKEGIFIINTARALLVDEKAILSALNSGNVMMYATDVYELEPPELTDLITHERTICTPHIGGYTIESVDRSTEMAVDNILKEFI